MNDSNPVVFTVTSHLCTGMAGSRHRRGSVGGKCNLFKRGVYNSGAGSIQDGTTTDTFHFVYRPLSGTKRSCVDAKL